MHRSQRISRPRSRPTIGGLLGFAEGEIVGPSLQFMISDFAGARSLGLRGIHILRTDQKYHRTNESGNGESHSNNDLADDVGPQYRPFWCDVDRTPFHHAKQHERVENTGAESCERPDADPGISSSKVGALSA